MVPRAKKAEKAAGWRLGLVSSGPAAHLPLAAPFFQRLRRHSMTLCGAVCIVHGGSVRDCYDGVGLQLSIQRSADLLCLSLLAVVKRAGYISIRWMHVLRVKSDPSLGTAGTST